jgi:hypothetical protein
MWFSPNDCNSCNINKRPGFCCAFVRFALEEYCPCRECLVKMMCKDFCEIRNEIKGNIFVHRGKNLHFRVRNEDELRR